MDDNLLIYENKHFRLEQCYTCPIPGYLILSPKNEIRSLSEMTQDALSDLGSTLSLAIRAIEAVLQPERVYCVSFGEESGLLHFHLFPRTRLLLDKYLKAHPGETEPVSGPRLFDWARQKYASKALELSGQETVQKICDWIKKSI